MTDQFEETDKSTSQLQSTSTCHELNGMLCLSLVYISLTHCSDDVRQFLGIL